MSATASILLNMGLPFDGGWLKGKTRRQARRLATKASAASRAPAAGVSAYSERRGCGPSSGTAAHVLEQPGDQLRHERDREPAAHEPARREDVARDEVDARLEARRHAGAVDQVVARRRRPGLLGQLAEPQPLAAGQRVVRRQHGQHRLAAQLVALGPLGPARLGLGVLEAHRGVQRRRRRPPRPAPRPTPRRPRPGPRGAARAGARWRPGSRRRARSGTRRRAASRARWRPARRPGRRPAPAGPRSRRRGRAAARPPRSASGRPGPRSSSRTPSWRSSELTCWETAGWVSASSSPARENERRRATSRNVSSRRGSIAAYSATPSHHSCECEFKCARSRSDECSMGRSKDQWIVRGSVAGLLAVLCFLAGFSIFTQRRAAAESKRADTAARLSTTYVDARHWVTEAKSLERRYRFEASSSVRGSHDTAKRRLAEDLQKVRAARHLGEDARDGRAGCSSSTGATTRRRGGCSRPSTRTTRRWPCSSTTR